MIILLILSLRRLHKAEQRISEQFAYVNVKIIECLMRMNKRISNRSINQKWRRKKKRKRNIESWIVSFSGLFFLSISYIELYRRKDIRIKIRSTTATTKK
jgi:uncharacterized membrane protein